MANTSQETKNHLVSALASQSASNELITTLDKVAGTTPGTTRASGAVVTDPNSNQGAAKVTALSVGTSGSESDVTNEVVALVGNATTCTFSPAQGSSNISLVTVTFKNADGNTLTHPVAFDIFLSDAATGVGLTATTASGAVAAGASGTDIGTLTTKKALRSMCDASGVYILSITDTSKTGFYVCVNLSNRPTIVSAQLVTGNYG